jgi:hypothetical protein
MKILVILLMLMTAIPAMAAEWVQVRTPGDNDLYYYDRSKLFVSGEEITYWKKVVFRTPQPVNGQYAASGLYRERIHCAEHTLKLISHLLYTTDGRSIEYIANHEGEAAPIIPDTLGDVFEQTACPLVRQRQDERQRRIDSLPIKSTSEAAAQLPAPSEEKILTPEKPPSQ